MGLLVSLWIFVVITIDQIIHGIASDERSSDLLWRRRSSSIYNLFFSLLSLPPKKFCKAPLSLEFRYFNKMGSGMLFSLFWFCSGWVDLIWRFKPSSCGKYSPHPLLPLLVKVLSGEFWIFCYILHISLLFFKLLILSLSFKF